MTHPLNLHLHFCQHVTNKSELLSHAQQHQLTSDASDGCELVLKVMVKGGGALWLVLRTVLPLPHGSLWGTTRAHTGMEAKTSLVYVWMS